MSRRKRHGRKTAQDRGVIRLCKSSLLTNLDEGEDGVRGRGRGGSIGIPGGTAKLFCNIDSASPGPTPAIPHSGTGDPRELLLSKDVVRAMVP